MNNYYGYVSKNSYSKLLSPVLNEEPVGLWSSIKNRQKIEKEAHLLQNRVNLLQQEEEKIGKKISDTKKKMLEYIEKKRQDYHEFSHVKPLVFFYGKITFVIENEKKRK